MCDNAGIKFVYLPPYSLDLNPIEEFFAELKKTLIKRKWDAYENLEQDFSAFLVWCVGMAGRKEKNAKGHFRHTGLTIEEPEVNIPVRKRSTL